LLQTFVETKPFVFCARHIEDIEVEDLHQGATLFLPVFHSWQVSWWLPDAEQKHIMIEPLGSFAEDSSL